MCGIAGIVGQDVERDATLIDRLIGRLRHRGPDSRRAERFEACHLGHTRLSIIDLSTGDQPMLSADRRLAIVFNGEIYNYRELRAELVRHGCAFRTTSDTEVVLAAFARWGAACLSRLRGMYALAIWEPATRTLFAARDPFGEKPFFFVCDRSTLVFASEIKALEDPSVRRGELDEVALDRYLALGYVPPNLTVWSNVRTLEAGHFLRWRDGQVQVECFWQPELAERATTLGEATERLRELLAQAVRRQMVADVPVGAFLSGGCDSSTIVGLMDSAGGAAVKTFSVGFGRMANELPYARSVASAFATEHHEIDLGEPAVAELLTKLVAVYDEPFADSSAIPTYLIAKFARQHVKVVLSGDGGDELFGGYSWYNSIAAAADTDGSHITWFLLRAVSRLLGDRNAALLRRATAFGLAARWRDPWMQAAMSQTYLRSTDRARLWGRAAPPTSDVPAETFSPPASTRGLNRSFFFDIKSYLAGDILVKVDRASMAHGLECRAPFLDLDLAEFALSLPTQMKATKGANKVALRAAAQHLWPPAIRSRSKMGFGAPYVEWLARTDVRELLAHVFRGEARLRALLPGLPRGQENTASYPTWMLLVLGLWLEQVDGN